MNKRKRIIALLAAVSFVLMIFLQGCSNTKLQNSAENKEGQTASDVKQDTQDDKQNEAGNSTGDNGDEGNGGTGQNDETVNENGSGENDTAEPTQPETQPEPIDYSVVQPNETGRIMIVMFHNFIEKYTGGDKEYTTTFDEFEKLLDTLYTSGYRLISLTDYLTGNIDTPAGCIPIVFTFDDGTAGQFNLIEENGKLVANPRSAVGILEKFNETHPDFGIEGTFYINLGNQTFGNTGTLQERLQYLTDKGFELGNHTYNHTSMKKIKTSDEMQKELGMNQKKMLELIPGYRFNTFSLPYGAPSANLVEYIKKGEYEGTAYEHAAIMEVGWDPATSPFSVGFDPMSTHRVRSTGITKVDCDLAWWLENQSRKSQFVSDGDPSTVAVPEASADKVNKDALGDKKLVIY